MKVSAQYAEEHFSDILHTAMSGEDVEIAKPEQSSVHMTLVKSSVTSRRVTPRILGAGRGELVVPSWDEWKALDKEMERDMLDAPLISTGEL